MLLFAYAYLSDVKGFVWRQSERRIFCALTSVGALFIFTFLEEVKIMETIRGWYANIGKKIKTLAIILFIFGTVMGIFLAVHLVSNYEDLIFFGLLVLVIAPIGAFVSSWILYGFGEIVDNSQIITKRLDSENVPVIPVEKCYLCPSCDEEIEEGCLECPKCGQEIEWQ